jgi:hypothetical protein
MNAPQPNLISQSGGTIRGAREQAEADVAGRADGILDPSAAQLIREKIKNLAIQDRCGLA